MSLDTCHFFKVRHGLPDPNGSLSSDISSAVIALAKTEVEKLVNDCRVKKVRGPYKKLHTYFITFIYFSTVSKKFEVRDYYINKTHQKYIYYYISI